MTTFLQFFGIAAIGASCYFFGALRTAAYLIIAIAFFLAVTLPAYWNR